MIDENTKFENMQWAIDGRNRNQNCNLRLLKLFEGHGSQWSTKDYSFIAHDLLAVAFSLWRAAFLADKTGKRSEVFSHAKIFLETIIQDNNIGYPQDKKSLEWTFNFYTRNARYALEHLHKLRPNIVPKYETKTRTPKERWEYCQFVLEDVIGKFEIELNEKLSQKQASKLRSVRKRKQKEQREIVRSLMAVDRARK